MLEFKVEKNQRIAELERKIGDSDQYIAKLNRKVGDLHANNEVEKLCIEVVRFFQSNKH